MTITRDIVLDLLPLLPFRTPDQLDLETKGTEWPIPAFADRLVGYFRPFTASCAMSCACCNSVFPSAVFRWPTSEVVPHEGQVIL